MKQNQTGIFEITVYRKDGTIKDREIVKNSITHIGIGKQNELLLGISTSPFKYIAVGAGGADADPTQTQLTEEITSGGLSRAEADSVNTDTEYNNDDTAKLTKDFVATADHTVEEVGIFNALTNGEMFSRVTSTKEVDSGETLSVVYRVTNDTNSAS